MTHATCRFHAPPQGPELKELARSPQNQDKLEKFRKHTVFPRDQHSIAMEQPLKPSSFQIVKTQEIKNRTQFRPQLMWWQPPNVQKIWPEQTETPHSSHGSSCTFCDLDGQIAESTGTWMRQSAWCLVAYPIVSVATKELSESVLLAVSIAPQGILLLSQWHCIRILYCSLSLTTCHPVQCSPNMRVADCATFWVCKCWQLIYRGALHLALFDIYIAIYTKYCFSQTSLSWCYDYLGLEFLRMLWFAREHQKTVMGFGLGPFEDKQVGHVQGMGSKCKIAEKQLKLELGKA